MKSKAQHLLLGQSVELESYQKSIGQMLIEMPLSAIGVLLVDVIPGVIISFAFESIWGYILFAPFSIFAFCMKVKEDWRGIGERVVCIDPEKRVLVVKQKFPHQPHLRDEIIKFKDLLLFRLWRAESEDEPAAFILRVQISKDIFRPDVSGYLLHLELATRDATSAEEITVKLAERIVAATGIDYFDIQHCKDERFALWSNPSLVARHRRA